MQQFIVDAFTDRLFAGNQAAVCLPDAPLPDALMLQIARENNFSETAFLVPEADGWRLRWFTPAAEIDLCGHATLAAAYVILRIIEPHRDAVTFRTRSGNLYITRENGAFAMEFPAYTLHPAAVTPQMCEAIGADVQEAYLDRDLLLVLSHAADVRDLHPDAEKLTALEGLLTAVTAPADSPEFDCVSRVFAPKAGIAEDPRHRLCALYDRALLGKAPRQTGDCSVSGFGKNRHSALHRLRQPRAHRRRCRAVFVRQTVTLIPEHRR